MGSKKGVLFKKESDRDGIRHSELDAVTNNTEWFKHHRSLFTSVQDACSFSAGGCFASITQLSPQELRLTRLCHLYHIVFKVTIIISNPREIAWRNVYGTFLWARPRNGTYDLGSH